MEEKKPKIRSIVIDTCTAIMERQYVEASERSINQSQWKDWGMDLINFYNYLQDEGFETLIILGEPGSGKSFLMKNLPSKTNIWFNADKKNPTWKGGKSEYGTKTNPVSGYHKITDTYEDVYKLINTVKKNNLFAEKKYAFLLGHIEYYKTEGDFNLRTRLKVPGSLTKKMELEAKAEHVLYAYAKPSLEDADEIEYYLETRTNGYNTARSGEGLFDSKRIPNDLNLIIEALENYE